VAAARVNEWWVGARINEAIDRYYFAFAFGMQSTPSLRAQPTGHEHGDARPLQCSQWRTEHADATLRGHPTVHAHEAALPWQWTQCRLAGTHLLVAWRAHPRVHEHTALNPRQCSQ
jgi:hypothetical protein